MIGWAVHREMLLAGIRSCKAAGRVKISREAVALAPLLQRCVVAVLEPGRGVSDEGGAAMVVPHSEGGDELGGLGEGG